MLGCLLVLLYLPALAATEEADADSITTLQKVEVVEVQRIDLVQQDWSGWTDCSDECGGCGLQNRSVTLPNSTYVVHVRHCNLVPCDEDEEQCCEPFVLQNGKCVVPIRTEGSAPTFSSSQNDTDVESLAFAWNGTGTVPPIFDDVANNSADLDTLFGVSKNGTDLISSGLNGTVGSAGGGADGSSSHESTGEVSQFRAGSIQISQQSVEVDIHHDPRRKKGRGGRRGSRRGYKRRQRKRQRDPAEVAESPQNLTVHDESEKEFDAFYPDYYDYYYYYYY